MNKHLQSFIFYVLIISVLNGAFFNRIGSRIADRPYFAVIYKAISSAVFNKTVDVGGSLHISKRMAPNNLPPHSLVSFDNIYTISDIQSASSCWLISEIKISYYEQLAILTKGFQDVPIKPPS